MQKVENRAKRRKKNKEVGRRNAKNGYGGEKRRHYVSMQKRNKVIGRN